MSSLRVRLAPFAAVLALALLVAGCGDSKPSAKQEYAKQFKAIGKQFLTQVQSLQAGLADTTDPGKRGAALDAATKAFSKLADRLDKIQPPKAIAGAQQKFVAKLREIASDLGDVKRGLAAKSKARIRAAARKLMSDGNDAKQVGGQIDDFVK